MVGATVVGPVSIPTQNVPRIPRVTPRRGKAHVAKACQNCKKAHLSCDDQRPCGRCVATRKEVGLPLEDITDASF
jgi:Fungal Zn(2)-Cys(6) binuclear cluster domain